MTTTRQDAWSEDEDLLLAEVVLRHIREGGTQLAAFEEIGIKLNRTAAACGFRWNSLIRKKYEAAIQIAKAQRQKRKYHRSYAHQQQPVNEQFDQQVEFSENLGEQVTPISHEEGLTFDHIIRFLKQQKQIVQDLSKANRALLKQLEEKNRLIEEIEKENKKMKHKLNYIESDYQVVNEDYKALIQIIDRARKLSIIEDTTTEKPRFRMDSNGNLERIDKVKTEID